LAFGSSAFGTAALTGSAFSGAGATGLLFITGAGTGCGLTGGAAAAGLIAGAVFTGSVFTISSFSSAFAAVGFCFLVFLIIFIYRKKSCPKCSILSRWQAKSNGHADSNNYLGIFQLCSTKPLKKSFTTSVHPYASCFILFRLSKERQGVYALNR
jgi:hypothetical protein